MNLGMLIGELRLYGPDPKDPYKSLKPEPEVRSTVAPRVTIHKGSMDLEESPYSPSAAPELQRDGEERAPRSRRADPGSKKAQIIEALRAAPGMTVPEIGEATNLGNGFVSNTLATMIIRDEIARAGTRGEYRYSLKV